MASIEAELPPRCVKCNHPVEKMDRSRRYTWHHPGWYLLILAYLIIYAIVAFFVQKKARLTFGLCAEHRKQRKMNTAMAFALFFTGMIMVFFGISTNRSFLAIIGGLVALASMMVAANKTRILKAIHITATEARYKGCGEAFLASLPARNASTDFTSF